MRKTVALFVVPALVGCASWHKPGASEAEFYQDRGECNMQAAAAYPAMMVSSGGYQAPTQTVCRPIGFGQTQCQTTPGAVVPGIQTDQNAVARAMAVNDCLRGNGWRTD